jgi:hypothetical protein
MKTTKLLIYITFTGLFITLIAIVFFGVVVLKKDFKTQEIEKTRFEEIKNRSTTAEFKLPMDLAATYFLRIKDGKVLIDSYFLKIKEKSIPDAFLSKSDLSETDYPNPTKGNLYSMPQSDGYLYIKTDFPTLETALNIWKSYFILSFVLLFGAIVLVILFLRNCDSGNFFNTQNSIYLRIISYLALGYCLMDYAFQWLILQEMNSQLEDLFNFSLNSNLDFNWRYLIFSFFLILIAQAFTEGAKLKEEQSLTI